MAAVLVTFTTKALTGVNAGHMVTWARPMTNKDLVNLGKKGLGCDRGFHVCEKCATTTI